MKAIPIITVLLIAQTMFLNHVDGELGRVHFAIYKQLPASDRQLLNANSHWLQLAGLSWFGLSLLSFGLVVVIWQNHLAPRSVVIGIGILWLIMFLSNLSWHIY